MKKHIVTNEKFHNLELIPEKRILAFKEAVVYLDVSKSLLYKLTSDRAITYSKPNGGKLYFKKTDLDSWMTQNQLKSITVLGEEVINHLKRK